MAHKCFLKLASSSTRICGRNGKLGNNNIPTMPLDLYVAQNAEKAIDLLYVAIALIAHVSSHDIRKSLSFCDSKNVSGINIKNKLQNNADIRKNYI